MGRTTRLEIVDHSLIQKSYIVHSDATGSPWADALAWSGVAWLLLRSGYYTWMGLLLAGVWVKLKSGTVTSESLLAVRSLGLQLTTLRGLILRFPFSSSTFTLLRSSSNVLLPLGDIQDITLNEVIYGWGIRYVLVVIQKPKVDTDDGKLIIAYEVRSEHPRKRLGVGRLFGAELFANLFFPEQELMPRLPQLERVWRGVRSVLFDELDREDSDTDTDLERENKPPIDS
ncbi:BZ3500_MvSof-1268-A1-R1_Chr8-2g10276 [Microbotryum saponariae]|uniref:BZ3500_MvSof-1268-A1-R1_Chr8-2g10276 protein n=1 Tax=Microbotryum saponariae TaxID=289078 RepID=A0A2X0N9S8_9BASI|nr:BZ3500_MvSof-1268-A1-R1_Chr8-2g10276 [Microbotryum saponariae]SDA02076.1 BZ3501_MvSof-1269-A2-R1_Chr8-2g10026 [Microbotryum saponariae]